ncbi:MAG: helix-turn-helix domain-containing protein [Dysgonomonas sp.]|nr:helix-turn-helix domain-containing protein [Dysgonomonas sp.]
MDTLKLDERLERIERLLLNNKKVLNFEETCEYTGLSRSYLYKLTAAALIPHSKPNGKVLYFDKDKLDSWLLENHVKTRQEIEKEASSFTFRKK